MLSPSREVVPSWVVVQGAGVPVNAMNAFFTTKLRLFMTSGLMLASLTPAYAADWKYAGTYSDLKGKEYMSFLDSTSVSKRGTSEVTVLVRSVWTKALYAYWRKHGSDDDILDSGAERTMAGDIPEYFSLPIVIKKLPAKDLKELSIIAIGHEFIVNAERVPSRVDILWRIDCRRGRFANTSTIVYKPSGKIADVIKPAQLTYYQVVLGTEQDYLQQLACKRMV